VKQRRKLKVKEGEDEGEGREEVKGEEKG
jgi:hypothetical protein